LHWEIEAERQMMADDFLPEPARRMHMTAIWTNVAVRLDNPHPQQDIVGVLTGARERLHRHGVGVEDLRAVGSTLSRLLHHLVR
jgi:hypothetical protein